MTVELSKDTLHVERWRKTTTSTKVCNDCVQCSLRHAQLGSCLASSGSLWRWAPDRGQRHSTGLATREPVHGASSGRFDIGASRPKHLIDVSEVLSDTLQGHGVCRGTEGWHIAASQAPAQTTTPGTCQICTRLGQHPSAGSSHRPGPIPAHQTAANKSCSTSGRARTEKPPASPKRRGAQADSQP